MHLRGVKMAKISKQNVRCHVGKARLRNTKPAPFRVALNNMASNREGAFKCS
jgi:hypothetical protein